LVDEGKIVQVIENILSNGVKYSPSGGPITVRGKISGNGYLLSVIDRGIGMTPEQSARVFDKFYRADSSNTAVGGTGLGMHIVKYFVEAHGGTIAVESAPGSGTAVHVTLPLYECRGGDTD
jgi:signal transduction histidine kinase